MFLFRIVTAGINPFGDAPAMTALDAATGGAASSLLNTTGADDDDEDDASASLDGPVPGSPPRRQPRAAHASNSLLSPLRRLFGSSAPSGSAPPRAATVLSDPTFSARTPPAVGSARQLMPLPTSRIVAAGLTSSSFAPLRREGPGAAAASAPLPAPYGAPRRGRCACSLAGAAESARARCFTFCSSFPVGCTCCAPLFRPPRVPLSALPLTPVQQDRVDSIRTRAGIPFDAADESHRSQLYSFAVAAFGPGFTMQELFSSPRWAALGFQGRNPATDFRGAGLFGLQCLHYLVGLEPRVVRRMAQREHGSVLHYLPFAIAGLNLAFTLLQALQLSPPADRGAGGADPLLTPTEAEVHLAFCALLAQEQFAFEEIFRSSMLYLEELWTDTHAQYSQFNAVLLAVRERVETTLLRRPLSMDEFARLLQEGDDGEGGLM